MKRRIVTIKKRSFLFFFLVKNIIILRLMHVHYSMTNLPLKASKEKKGTFVQISSSGLIALCLFCPQLAFLSLSLSPSLNLRISPTHTRNTLQLTHTPKNSFSFSPLSHSPPSLNVSLSLFLSHTQTHTWSLSLSLSIFLYLCNVPRLPKKVCNRCSKKILSKAREQQHSQAMNVFSKICVLELKI